MAIAEAVANLHTVVIPPHRLCIRTHQRDRIFLNQTNKLQAVVDEIVKVNQTRRPILVGTASVNESKILHEILQTQELKTAVLNADNNEDEAEIIAQAGRLGTITISTNMAG